MFGSLMIDLDGHSLTAIEKDLIQHQHVGGILLFTRNFRSISQLKELVAEIRERAKKQLLIKTWVKVTKLSTKIFLKLLRTIFQPDNQSPKHI